MLLSIPLLPVKTGLYRWILQQLNTKHKIAFKGTQLAHRLNALPSASSQSPAMHTSKLKMDNAKWDLFTSQQGCVTSNEFTYL